MKLFCNSIVLAICIAVFASCQVQPVVESHNADHKVRLLLSQAKYSEAQAAYDIALQNKDLSQEFINKYGNYFEVIALYDHQYEKQPKPPYRYASCADLSKYGEEVVEWRSIAAQGNPFALSNIKIKQAQEELTALQMWNTEADGIASVEFQKAIIYYRLLYGMNVECVLYPCDLMLKSTFCSLFSDDIRCQQGYEF